MAGNLRRVGSLALHFDRRAKDAAASRTVGGRATPAARIARLAVGCGAERTMKRLPSFNAAALVKLAKLRHRLLNDAPPDAHAPHQPPVAVDLPVLLANRVAQIHAPSESAASTRCTSRKIAKMDLQLRKLG
jgi:hypothetical protein